MQQTLERPDFPTSLDNTMVSAFRGCPRYMYNTYILNWKSPLPNIHLHAGKSFARGVEIGRKSYYMDKLPVEQAYSNSVEAFIEEWGSFEAPEGSNKSFDRVKGALEFYWEHYPLDAPDAPEPFTDLGGNKGIEYSFAEPLPIKHPQTGDPLLYVGSLDMAAKAYKGLYVYDEKTTSSLGASWGKQWELRGQFSGYIWALQQLGLKPNGAIVRGVSILKTKYDTMEVLTYRSEAEILKWYYQLLRTANQMIEAWEEGYFDYNFSDHCTAYGSCNMVPVCKASNEEEVLHSLFIKKLWNPVTREEILLEMPEGKNRIGHWDKATSANLNAELEVLLKGKL